MSALSAALLGPLVIVVGYAFDAMALVTAAFLAGPGAIWLGIGALRGDGDPASRRLGIAGIVLGILWVAACVAWVIWLLMNI